MKYLNDLEKDKRDLYTEDPEVFSLLLNFLVTIETNFHYSEKQEYIQIANDFLANQITAEDFSRFFMSIYEGIS